MKIDVKKISARFEKLSRRERAFVALALLALIYFAWESVFYIPVAQEHKELRKRIVQSERAVAELRTQGDAIMARKELDPNRDARSTLEALLAEQGRVTGKLEEVARALISPQEMVRVLQSFLESQKALVLLSLENLPPESLVPEGLSETAQPPTELFRHGLRMEFEGTYGEVHSYLKALEAMDSRIFWDLISIEVQEHPKCKISLELFTLSLDQRWIGV